MGFNILNEHAIATQIPLKALQGVKFLSELNNKYQNIIKINGQHTCLKWLNDITTTVELMNTMSLHFMFLEFEN